MAKDKSPSPAPRKAPAPPWRVERRFDGKRTADQVAADLIKVHTPQP